MSSADRTSPTRPVSPIWNPEFFGNMMVVNGFTWPYLEVEPRRYRFRLLNGCNSRFLILQFEHPGVEVWQIGAEGGFLPAPVRLNDYPYPGSTGGGATVLLALAERADIIVDFSAAAGTSFRLLNLGPDEPFGGGEIGVDFDPSDPGLDRPGDGVPGQRLDRWPTRPRRRSSAAAGDYAAGRCREHAAPQPQRGSLRRRRASV